MELVIVESPAKAKTINKYLGSNYVVLASYGHVRDLPPRDGSVETDNGFAMHWELYADKARQLKAIADEAKKADRVILATDPDREGEAIAWHLLEWMRGKKGLLPKGGATRVTFNEITKPAILAAMGRPRDVDGDLVDAYRARRALDYLVGFNLSPVLWRKLPGAKSAGRVQSVALRIVVDREREIETFVNREYWTVEASLATTAGTSFVARLTHWNGKKLDRFDLAEVVAAQQARADVESGKFTVSAVETKPVSRNPYPPFTTSTLQQEAARKLGFTASHTMRVAQGLYEDGHITYMRTDGVQVAGEAIAAARAVIAEDFGGGENVLPKTPRHYSTKAKNAQEAHEAIRPTDLTRRPGDGISGDNGRLYALIWKRTIASQMASAKLERTAVDLTDAAGKATLRASGQVVLHPGFLAVYTETVDDADEDDDDTRRLPKLVQGEHPQVTAARADQHFTEPPPRYSEASLVKRLEELGIGRPSTYASILQTLRDRLYVRMEKNRFFAEEKGRLVTAFLERYFEKYVSYDFTAELENRLDEVSAGSLDYLTVLDDFWKDFSPKTKEVLDIRPSDVTVALDEFLSPFLFPPKADGSDPRLCPTCGNGRLGLKTGKFGAFVSCSNYPDCRYTRQFGEGGELKESTGPVVLGDDPATGQPVSLRSGRFGAYVQRGEDGAKDDPKPPRASIPKDMAVAGPDDLPTALMLLSLPRTVGDHPETGSPITASIGRYGPYLAHAGKYARLTSSAEVFETGMNSAVAKLADAAANPGRARNAPVPLREVGPHPVSGAAIKLMEGRFGPYLTDGATNANVPKGEDGLALTIDAAAALIDARAALPAKGKKPVRKAAKAAVKKVASKPAAKALPAKTKPAARRAKSAA